MSPSPNFVNNDYFLIFSQHFDRDRGLDMGRLSINSLRKGTIDLWMATSSIATKQGFESFHQWGGMLPPQYRVPQLKHWTVQLGPIPLHHVKGVEGNFYKLLPHEVTTDRNGKRSDFGIHKDANQPGSLGCIVLSDDRFAAFERRMREIRAEGILQIALFVQYS